MLGHPARQYQCEKPRRLLALCGGTRPSQAARAPPERTSSRAALLTTPQHRREATRVPHLGSSTGSSRRPRRHRWGLVRPRFDLRGCASRALEPKHGVSMRPRAREAGCAACSGGIRSDCRAPGVLSIAPWAVRRGEGVRARAPVPGPCAARRLIAKSRARLPCEVRPDCSTKIEIETEGNDPFGDAVGRLASRTGVYTKARRRGRERWTGGVRKRARPAKTRLHLLATSSTLPSDVIAHGRDLIERATISTLIGNMPVVACMGRMHKACDLAIAGCGRASVERCAQMSSSSPTTEPSVPEGQ